ncbi:T9SS type A sorting domain-containing protein [Spirosoma soli]|uniref:T9SS type A sorting domain-containing protein n=2 Tax=Spirosoma soli TaxID=1770529 RepID=A0ABW5MCY2_9BACT
MISSSDVRYMVSYDSKTSLYTAWVIPNYSTPNANNPEAEDRGATAQFSLKVSKDFVLTDVSDVRGTWDKAPYKLLTPESFASESNSAYYIIGKTPQETNYGAFVSGEPVALFTFKGKGGSPEQVQALTVEDKFVQFAESKMSLNIRSSFYSRSGQRASISAHPLEQLSGVTTLAEVLKQKQAQLGLALNNTDEDVATLSVQAYPNPATDVIEVKYFSATDQPGLRIDMLDNQGNIKQSNTLNAKTGFNATRFVVSNLPGGVYFVRGDVQGQRITKKIVKQ